MGMLYRHYIKTRQLHLMVERCVLDVTPCVAVPFRSCHHAFRSSESMPEVRIGDSSNLEGDVKPRSCGVSHIRRFYQYSALSNKGVQRIRSNSYINVNLSCPARWMSSWSRKSGSTMTSPLCPIQKSSFFSAFPEKKKEFVERMVVGYSAEQMFSVVSDVENYKNFLPWCESSTVKSRRKDHVLADLIIGMSPVTESYTSSVYLTKPISIRAESTKGRFFSKMLTFWRFSPGLKDKPQTCIIDFYVSLEFRSAIHANVANVFFNEVVKAMTGAFYEEAKRRYGPAACPSRKIISTKPDNDV